MKGFLMINYAITISFLEPVEGVVFLSARSPEEARLKAIELYQNRTNVNIVDIKETDEEVDFSDIWDTDDKRELN